MSTSPSPARASRLQSPSSSTMHPGLSETDKDTIDAGAPDTGAMEPATPPLNDPAQQQEEDSEPSDLPTTLTKSLILDALPPRVSTILSLAATAAAEAPAASTSIAATPIASASASASAAAAASATNNNDTNNTTQKVTVHFKSLPGSPTLRQPRFKCNASQRFEAVVRFLRKKLAVPEEQGVYCYINSVFAPGLDEGVGNLWRCFKTGEELVVNYGVMQAFG